MSSAIDSTDPAEATGYQTYQTDRAPVIAQQQAQSLAQTQAQQDQIQSLYTDPKAFDAFSSSDSVQRAVLASPNPDQEKFSAANRAFMGQVMHQEPDEMGNNYEPLRDAYSQKNFGIASPSEEQFYTAVKGQFQKGIETRDALNELPQKVVAATVDGLASGEPASIPAVLTNWKESHPDLITPDNEAQFMQSAQPLVADAQKYSPAVSEIFNAVSQEAEPKNPEDEGKIIPSTVNTASVADMQPIVDKLSQYAPEEQTKILGMTGLYAKEHGIDPKTFYPQLLEAAGRSIQDIVAGGSLGTAQVAIHNQILALQNGGMVDENGQPQGQNFGQNSGLVDLQMHDPTPQERSDLITKLQGDLASINTVRQVRQFVTGQIDPIKATMSGGMGMAQNAAYGLAGMAPYAAASLADPVAGAALMTTAFTATAHDDLMTRFPNLDPVGALAIAGVGGVAQTALMSMTLGNAAGKLPMTMALLKNLANPSTETIGTLGKWAAKTTLGAGEIAAQNAGMVATPIVLTQLASSLGADMPGVNWKNSFQDFKDALPSTLPTVIALSLIGGAAIGLHDVPAMWRARNDASTFESIGFPSDLSKQIATASPDEKDALFQKGWKGMTSDDRQQLVDTLNAHAANAESDQNSPNAPTLHASPNEDGSFSLELHDSQGRPVYSSPSLDSAVTAFHAQKYAEENAPEPEAETQEPGETPKEGSEPVDLGPGAANASQFEVRAVAKAADILIAQGDNTDRAAWEKSMGEEYDGISKPELDEKWEQAQEAAAKYKEQNGDKPVLEVARQMVSGSIQNDSPTGVKNRIVDKERKAMGLEPLMKPETQTEKVSWDLASKAIDENPQLPENLISELEEKPRALSAVENDVLLQHTIGIRHEYMKANRDVVVASEKWDQAGVDEATARRAKASDEYLRITNATKKAGTESGRSLQARKKMANEDLSLEHMVTERRAAKGGKPLSEKEHAETEKLQKERTEAHKAEEAQMEKKANESRDANIQRIINKVLAEREKKSGAIQTARASVSRAGKSTVAFFEKKAAAARERLSKQNTTFGSTIDPQAFADYAIIGAEHLAHGIEKGAAWTAKMVEEFGDKIKPHLSAILAKSEALFSSRAGNEQILDAIAAHEKLGSSDYDLGRYAQHIAENFVRSGITDREALISVTHEALQEANPDISRRETMDAISGYGKYTELSKEAVKTQIRDLKGQMQQVGKLQDMQAGNAPKKTGGERRTPSDEERRLVQQVNEAKKKGGYNVTDPAKQLQSAMGAIHTRLTNEIKDLTHQIETGARPEGKAGIEYDDKAKALKARRDELMAQRKAIDDAKNPKPTADEQEQDKLTKQIADLDKRIQAGDIAAKERGEPKDASPETERLRAERDAMNKLVSELRAKAKDSRTSEEKALDASKRAVEASMKEYDRRIKAGDFSGTGEKKKLTDPELEALKARRDASREEFIHIQQLDEHFKAEKAEKKNASDIAKVREQIKAKDAQIQAGEIAAKERGDSNDSPELEGLKAERDAMNRQIQKMRNDAKPKRTPDEIGNQAMRARLANKMADLEDRMARGDFSKPDKRELKLDPETIATKAKAAEVEDRWQRMLATEREKNKSGVEKTLDTVNRWRRFFILSGYSVLAKLTAAAGWRTLITPIEEGAGSVIRRALPNIAARAAREGGGFNVRAEARAITQTVTQGMKDSAEYMKTGKGPLQKAFGKKEYGAAHNVAEFWGRLHGTLKSPVLRNEFERSFQIRMEHAIANGEDVSDEGVRIKIGVQAFKDAQRSIFMQDNKVVSAYKRGISALEEPNSKTGKVSDGAYITAAALKFMMPVVKIPSNVVAETFQYVFGHALGSYHLIKAVKAGINNLHPDDADLIMREFKKGSLGSAGLITGFLMPQMFGGYYQPGEKRKDTDAQVGGVRIAGHNIPNYLVHNPLLETFQIGATVRRVMEEKFGRNKETKGLGMGLLAAAGGLLEEQPFIGAAVKNAEALDPREQKSYFGELAKSIVIPQGLSQLAADTDRNSQGQHIVRKPQTVGEYLKTGIPGLREDVKKKAGQAP